MEKKGSKRSKKKTLRGPDRSAPRHRLRQYEIHVLAAVADLSERPAPPDRPWAWRHSTAFPWDIYYRVHDLSGDGPAISTIHSLLGQLVRRGLVRSTGGPGEHAPYELRQGPVVQLVRGYQAVLAGQPVPGINWSSLTDGMRDVLVLAEIERQEGASSDDLFALLKRFGCPGGKKEHLYPLIERLGRERSIVGVRMKPGGGQGRKWRYRFSDTQHRLGAIERSVDLLIEYLRERRPS